MPVKENESETQWHIDEFAEVELKDVRLNRRCAELAGQLDMNSEGSINQACEDWADTKAAYRFFDNKKVTPKGIQGAHRSRTVERMREHKRVLAIQDTSFLNYTHHPKTEKLGEIGNKTQNQRGFWMHSTLAVTEKGVPLGLLTQDFFTRPIGEPAHRPEELAKLPIEEKESYRWLQAFEQTLALAPDDVEVITVCDREADIYEMFVLAQKEEASLLVRASSNRKLLDEETGKLWPSVEQQPIAGNLTVDITGNSERKARTANVSVRYTSVELKPPWRPNQLKLPPVTLNAILVREEHPSPDVDDPIEWLLLTNTPVDSFEDAERVIQWYCTRWQIELFHKVLKSGCNVEECRLKTAPRLQNFIALMSIIAWRLHWMTFIQCAQPDSPCTTVLTTIEWQALYMRIHKSHTLPDNPPSVRQAVRWIAQLGGFLARKSDGEPGITAVWRGWQRLQDIASTLYLVNQQQYPQTYG